MSQSQSKLDIHLHPQQGLAYRSQATEILYGGAAGGGKSHLMRVVAVIMCGRIAGLQVYLFRRLSDDLYKNHMEGAGGFLALLSAWFDSGHVKYNGSKNFLEFWNGSKIWLSHCQHEKDVMKYQGPEIHLLLIDELTHFSEKQYRFLRSRCRLGGLNVPSEFKGQLPRIICGSNPGSVGHNWVKSTFVDYSAPLEVSKTPKDEGGMLRQYIPAKMDDNPTLLESDPDYLEKLEGLAEPELVRAMKDGDWDIVAGGMFDDVWKRERQVIEPFEIPSTWRIDRSFDWGSSAPFSVGWWAESDGSDVELNDGSIRSYPRGTVFRIGEWYGWNGKPNQGCRMLAKEIGRGILQREADMRLRGRVKPGPADSAIWTNENGSCIADDMNTVGVRWEKADKTPGSRKNGWQKVRSMLKASLQSPIEDPALFIFEGCTHFIRTVPVLSRLDRDNEDIDTKAEDHVADEVRYRLTAKHKLTETSEFRI